MMAKGPARRTVTVQLNLQQYQVLEDVRKQGKMGATDGDVIRRAFLKWFQQKKKERIPSRSPKTRRSR